MRKKVCQGSLEECQDFVRANTFSLTLKWLSIEFHSPRYIVTGHVFEEIKTEDGTTILKSEDSTIEMNDQ